MTPGGHVERHRPRSQPANRSQGPWSISALRNCQFGATLDRRHTFRDGLMRRASSRSRIWRSSSTSPASPHGIGTEFGSSLGPPSMTIVHPDFARIWVKYFEVPGDVDVVLADRAGTIEGQVVVEETGKAAAGVTVAFDSLIDAVRSFTSCPTGTRWTLPCSHRCRRDRTAFASAHRQPVRRPRSSNRSRSDPGRTAQAPVMRLVKGGVIEGRIVDDITGKHGAGITVDLQGVYQQKGNAPATSTRP